MLRKAYVLICLLLLPVAVAAQAPQEYDRSEAQEPPPAAPGELLPPPLGAIDLLLNGSFEDNGGVGTSVFADWTVFDVPGSVSGTPGNGTIVVQTGTTAPISASMVEAPTDGTFAAMADGLGPSAKLIYQDFTVPAGGGALSCDVYINNQAMVFIDAGTLDFQGPPNQHARLDLMDPAAPVDDVGAGVLENLFITNPGDPPVQSYQTIGTDLGPYAGQTIRLRLAEVDNQFFFNAGVDNCVAVGEELPVLEIPTLGMVGLAALVLLLLGMGFYALRRRSTV